MHDVIVVGARCAGAPTAMLLARKGYRVLLVDRASFPSDVPHGHFLHRGGPKRLAKWGLLDRVTATNCPAATTSLMDLGDFPLVGTGLVVDGIPLGYRTLGDLIGRREQGEALARNAEDTVKAVTQRISGVPPERRPRVYYARGPRGLETGLGGSINVETIELLAQNVAGGTRGGLANVSIEQVLLWNPDVIITIDQDFAATVLSDPTWAPVAAVRARRVHLSPKLPFGWVDFPPTVNRLIGLWWLGKILYPDLFPEDLRTLTREFYARYYHVTPDPAQIDRVLAGRD